MSDPVETYLALGWHPIVLHHCDDEGRCSCGAYPCGKDNRSAGKHPRERQWQRSGPAEYYPEGANIGLRMGVQPCGIRLLALDDDGGLAALEATLGALPETLTSRTPSGGAHRVFTVPEGPKFANAVRVAGHAVDVRCDGGQIVVAPSRTPRGEYAWAVLTDPVPLPDAWLRALSDVNLAVQDDPRLLAERAPRVARADAEAAAIEWAKRAPIAVEGHGGHTALFELLATLIRGYGLDPERASEIAAEHYNPRCKPPFDVGSREWEHKVESATAAERDPGYLLAPDVLELEPEAVRDISVGKGDLWFEPENFAKLVELFRADELAYARLGHDLALLIPKDRWRELDRLVRRCVKEQARARAPKRAEERAIIGYESRAWVTDGSGGYHAPVRRSNLLARLTNLGRDDLIVGDETSTWRFNVSIATRAVRDFGQRAVARWEDPETVVTGCPIPEIPAIRDPGVDAWLRAVFGPGYDAACQWIAVNTPEHAHRLSAVLVLIGPTSAGKSLLATCFARLWGATGYVRLGVAVSRFNGACERTPVWCDDECVELQRGELTSSDFVDLVQRREHDIELKGQERTVLRGAPRIVLTCNDLEQVTFRDSMGVEAIRALAGRLSVHDFRTRETEVARTLDALRVHGSDDVDVPRILGHLRAIQRDTEPVPARFAGAWSHGGEAEQIAIAGARARCPEVFEALDAGIESGGNAWLFPEGGRWYVHPQSLALAVDVPLPRVYAALRTISHEHGRGERREINGRRLRVWRLG